MANIAVTKGCACVKASLSVCVCPVTLMGELGLKWISQVFPQVVLTSSTLIENRIRKWAEGTRVSLWLSETFSLCSVAVSATGGGDESSCWSTISEVQVSVSSIPFKYVYHP